MLCFVAMTIGLCHGGVCESSIRCSWPAPPSQFPWLADRARGSTLRPKSLAPRPDSLISGSQEMDDAALQDYCHRLPKVELHAHLGGSVRMATLADLSKALPERDALQEALAQCQVKQGDARTQPQRWALWDVIHRCTGAAPQTRLPHLLRCTHLQCCSSAPVSGRE